MLIGITAKLINTHQGHQLGYAKLLIDSVFLFRRLVLQEQFRRIKYTHRVVREALNFRMASTPDSHKNNLRNTESRRFTSISSRWRWTRPLAPGSACW